METLILSSEDVRRLVAQVGLHTLMDDMISRLMAGFQAFDPKDTVVPARSGFMYDRPVSGLLEWMPCMRSNGRATIKVVGYHPGNPRSRGLPTILSTVSAYDTTTGHLVCMMDGTLITALRTGAASAVASSVMAIPAAKVLGLIGGGAQAITQLHALSRLFELEEVLVYDLDPDVQRSFTTRAACIGGGFQIRAASLDELVRSSDVICTATSVGVGEGPVFDGIEPKPWVHFNAVGSDFPGKVELPLTLLRRCFVCPDFREQAMKEGECQQLMPEDIGPSLFQLVQHPDGYRFVQQQMSVFDSTGWALEDQVAMQLFMEYATDLRLGSLLRIETVLEDAMNPYHFAHSHLHRLTGQSPVPAIS